MVAAWTYLSFSFVIKGLPVQHSTSSNGRLPEDSSSNPELESQQQTRGSPFAAHATASVACWR